MQGKAANPPRVVPLNKDYVSSVFQFYKAWRTERNEHYPWSMLNAFRRNQGTRKALSALSISIRGVRPERSKEGSDRKGIPDTN